MKRSADVAIVGFGIAGATLAQALLDRGIDVVVFDSPLHAAVSRGAGALSPVAGLRFGVLDNWHRLWSVAWEFYSRYEVIAPVPCYRLLYRSDECRFWERKHEVLSDAGIAEESTLPPVLAEILVQPQTTVRLRYAARVGAVSLLEKLRRQLEQNDRYIQQTITDSTMSYDAGRWNVAGLACRHIVLCEGPWLRSDGPFHWIPRMFARGQRIIGILATSVGHSPVWLSIRGRTLLLEEQRFQFGSTYDWSLIKPVVTDDTTQFLAVELRKILRCRFTVEGAWAGVRPIVADLQPVIGEHPEQTGLWIFNGLGSRGLLLAPYLAHLLADAITLGSAVPPQWDVRRFG